MSELEGHHRVGIGSDRNFGFVFAGAFAIVGCLPLLHGGSIAWWALTVAAVFLVIALTVPRLLRPLNIVWFRLGLLLGAVVAPIVMMIVFFVAVLPTGLILRLLGRDMLQLRLEPERASYWIKRSSPLGSMTQQY